ncbi:MAG: hypothetical protein BGO78_00605 [Chloroflexi bacterium 44-23]|nr:MAG: hypothetical protein BGO78_00605 [Chloroflexi bacterium 44-23]
MEQEMFVYHILTLDEWKKFNQEEIYQPPSLQNEGFIHLSYHQQVPATVNRFYNQHQKLVILKIEVNKINSLLRDEISGQDGVFPHLYGGLEKSAIRDVLMVENSAEGFHWP